MSRTIVALIAAALAGPATAQGRPDSAAMTCGQALALVRQRGALVLATGPLVYDRYVSDRGLCAPTQRTRQAFVATRDDPVCFVGFTCLEPEAHDPPSN